MLYFMGAGNLIVHFSEINRGKKNCKLMCQVGIAFHLSRIILNTTQNKNKGLCGGDVRY